MCNLQKEIKDLKFIRNFSSIEKDIVEKIYNFFSTKESDIMENELILNELKSISTETENIDSVKSKLNIKTEFVEDIYFYVENELTLNKKVCKYQNKINEFFSGFNKPKYTPLERIFSIQNKKLQDIWNIHFAHKKEKARD